jgi:hypothetical protein
VLVIVAAALRGAGAQYCPPGAATACDSVLIVHADPDYAADVKTTLQYTGAFVTVDLFNAFAATPTSEQLAPYDAVFVYSNKGFIDSTLLGNRLAAFHDNGGGVVVAMFANIGNSSGYNLKGAYGTAANGYALLDYTSGGDAVLEDSLGNVLEPQSPLMTGVASFAATRAFRSTAPVISGRAVIVAQWSGGGREPLVVRGTRGSRTLVELNIWPVSNRTSPKWWIGDGAALLRNALKYSRCMFCGPGTFSAAGEDQ